MLFKFLATVLLVALGADARKHMKSKIPKGTTESITVAVYLNDDMCMDVNELGNMTITAVRAPQGSSQCEETMLNVGTPANVPEGPAFLETVLGGLGIKNHELFYEETTLWKNKLSIKAGGSCGASNDCLGCIRYMLNPVPGACLTVL